MSAKRKFLYGEGSSKKDFKAFPVPVQKDMGVALFVVQLVERLSRRNPGAVYTVRVGDAVHGLHAFSEEVQVRHRYSAAGCGVDREAVEGSARPIRVEREIADGTQRQSSRYRQRIG